VAAHALAGLPAKDLADAGEEEAQVVVDLGGGADGGARVAAAGALLDGDRGGEALDEVGVGLGELGEELARGGAEALDVAALALGEDGVEGEAALARAGGAGDDDELAAREVEVDALQVVGAGAADADARWGRGGEDGGDRCVEPCVERVSSGASVMGSSELGSRAIGSRAAGAATSAAAGLPGAALVGFGMGR
jgi:hypothetical protein